MPHAPKEAWKWTLVAEISELEQLYEDPFREIAHYSGTR